MAETPNAAQRPWPGSSWTLNREWLLKAWRTSISSKRASGAASDPPFVRDLVGEKRSLGHGSEQVVYGFPEGTVLARFVIKESLQAIPWKGALLSRLIMRNGRLKNLLTWREIAAIKQSDNNIIRAILGEYVLPSSYVHGYASDRSGKVTNYCVQERVWGDDFATAVRKSRGALLLDQEVRTKLLDIVWGSKRVVLELGGPPDFYGGRNVLVLHDKRIVLNDTGFPSFTAAIAAAEDVPISVRLYCILMIQCHLRFVIDLERSLCPTEYEVAALSARFGASAAAFTAAVTCTNDRKRQLVRRLFICKA